MALATFQIQFDAKTAASITSIAQSLATIAIAARALVSDTDGIATAIGALMTPLGLLALNSSKTVEAINAGASEKTLAGVEQALLTIGERIDFADLASLPKMAAAEAGSEEQLAGIEAALAGILQAITTPPPLPATEIVLGAPILVKGPPMANFQLANDAVIGFPILDRNQAGVLVPPPSGDNYTVVSSNPASLNAVIGQAGDPLAPAVLVNALVAESDANNGGGGITFTVSDTAGLKSAVSQPIDIVADVVPAALDVGSPVVVGTQPVPTAPGP